MGGQLELSGIPEPIAKIYRQAYASFDHEDDPRVKRALIGVIGAVEKEVRSANHASDESGRMFSCG